MRVGMILLLILLILSKICAIGSQQAPIIAG